MPKPASPKKKRDQEPEDDQRRYPRLKPSSVPFLKSVSFSQGSEVQVIDISRGGMLIETEVRLRPQMKILLKLVTSDGIIKLDGLVLRSSISSLKGAPRYKSAIAFEHPFHMLDDLSENPEVAVSGTQPESGPAGSTQQGSEETATQPEDTPVLTFVAPDMPGTSLLEAFKLNDW